MATEATRASATKKSDATRARSATRLNARFTFLLYAAVALGTFSVEQTLRVTLLWSVLAALVLLHVAAQPLAMRYTFESIQRGVLIGLALTLPLAIVASDFLVTLASLSLGVKSGLLIFQRMVFIVAPLEEVFYRGCVQRERGWLETTIFYTLGALLFYWPMMQDFGRVLGIVVIGSAAFGFAFALVAKRYGLSAAIACHVVCNFGLFIAPALLREWSQGAP